MTSQLKLPRVRQFCCGCSLQTGAKIIAYAQILNVLSNYVFSVYFEYEESHTSRDFTQPHRDWKTFKNGFLTDQMMMSDIFTIVLFSSTLLHGIRKQYTMLMEPFLLLKGAGLLMNLCDLALITAVRALNYKYIHYFYELFSFGMSWYMFTVVYSHYQDLVDCKVTPVIHQA